MAPAQADTFWSISGDPNGGYVPDVLSLVDSGAETVTHIAAMGGGNLGFNGGLTVGPGGKLYAIANDSFGNSSFYSIQTNGALAFAHERLGSGLGNSGRLEEALEQFRLGDAALARAETRNPRLLQLVDRRADIAVVRGDAYPRAKRWREASDAWAAGVALKEDLRRRAPDNHVYADDLIEMRVKLADGYANLEQWSKAVETMELAMSALSDTVLHRPLASKEADWRNAGAAKLALWKQQIAAKN